MQVFSKILLMGSGKKEYTLTVSTDPVGATCTLTYDGQSYSAKTATVPEGTVISYSVYYSTYGTTTGTITMNSDKILTCTGTYSTTSTETYYSTPHNLTANGTIGGSSFAVTGSTTTTQYRAFDGDTTSNSGYWAPKNTYGYVPEGTYIELYYPTAVKIKSVEFLNRWGYANVAPKGWTFYYSDNGSSWTQISSGTNSVQVAGKNGGEWTVTGINNSSTSSSYFHKYYKFIFATDWYGYAQYYAGVQEMYPSAYRLTSSYTYYWNTSVT